MNNKLQQLAERRARLIQESASQRAQLTASIEVWREPLALADTCITAVGILKRHPVLLATGSAILLKLLRPSRIGKWMSRGWVAWKLLRKL